jgi:hypothetical protein
MNFWQSLILWTIEPQQIIGITGLKYREMQFKKTMLNHKKRFNRL